MIADSHAHLDMARFDEDREDVVQRARDSGVELILTIGTGEPTGSSIEKTLALAQQYDFVFAGIGVHPHDARLADDSLWLRMRQWCRHPKVVVWGEIGLDYYYDFSPRDVQQEVFGRQLTMAAEAGLPVSIHCRDAWPDLIRILREYWSNGGRPGILHSFTGTLDQALVCREMGFLLSFSGMITFKNGSALLDVAVALPSDSILVETDAPYLAPVPHRGKRNEPAFVIEIARRLAAARGQDFEEFARCTVSNLERLIKLPGRAAALPNL